MTEHEPFKTGQRVRFTIGPLGCVAHFDTPSFTPETVTRGDTGKYLGPHPNPRLKDKDWHLVAVNLGERDLYVPCHTGMFEAA